MTKRPMNHAKLERSHNDGLTYFQRYQLEGQKSHSVETFWAHLNAAGKPWCLSNSKEPPTREDLIQTRMQIRNLVILRDGTQFEYTEERELAEQEVDLSLGVWPPVRILCVATATQLATLEAKHGALPPRYYELPVLAAAA